VSPAASRERGQLAPEADVALVLQQAFDVTAGASAAIRHEPVGEWSGRWSPVMGISGEIEDWIRDANARWLASGTGFTATNIGVAGLAAAAAASAGSLVAVETDLRRFVQELADQEFEIAPVTFPVPLPVNVDLVVRYRSEREHVRESREGVLEALKRRLETREAAYRRRRVQDVVAELHEVVGLNQLTMARALGVTSAAVRKWLRGENARPEIAARLFRLVALLDLLKEAGVEEPAGWIDVPVSVESTLTPLNLFTAGRPDLVLLLANDAADPYEVLDEYDPDWRSRFAPDRFHKVVTLPGGDRAIVPRIGDTS
jgi:DNA-binding transcriptional regulator YiaG